jgi:hypothetical protein
MMAAHMSTVTGRQAHQILEAMKFVAMAMIGAHEGKLCAGGHRQERRKYLGLSDASPF